MVIKIYKCQVLYEGCFSREIHPCLVCVYICEELGGKMMSRLKNHVVKEVISASINGSYPGQSKLARKSLFAWGFMSYKSDHYSVLSSDPETPDEEKPQTIYACKFGHGTNYGHMLAIATEEGDIAVNNTSTTSESNLVTGHEIHCNAIMDVSWVPASPQIVSVSGDLRVILSAVREDGSLDPFLTMSGHGRSIKTIGVNQWDPSVMATGARDGSIIIWDQRCHNTHRADEIMPAHFHKMPKGSAMSPSGRKWNIKRLNIGMSVTGVVFQQQYVLMSSGASDGLIKIWDLRKTHSGCSGAPQYHGLLKHPGNSYHCGFTSLSLSPQGDTLYASCLDNTIYAYHLAKPTRKPVARYFGHQSTTYFVKSCLSPCGSYLLSGSSDGYAYIWLTERPGEPIAKLKGEEAEVTSVDWCSTDDEKLVTCIDDTRLCLFRRKNLDVNELMDKCNIHGTSQPYTRPNNIDTYHAIPHLPVTPSTSTIRNPRNITPSETGRSSTTPRTCPRTPQHFTPQLQNRSVGTPSPSTPKTSERNVLLEWLVSSRTPRPPQESPCTPDMTDRKTHKRKLDLVDEDQENLEKESHKSPSKEGNVLCPSSVINTQIPPVSVAKMLKYGDDSEAKCSKSQDEMADMTDSIKPLDDSHNVIGLQKLVTSSLKVAKGCVEGTETSRQSEQSVQGDKNITHSSCKSTLFGKFSSPTANLPNFVVDGTSPHRRPEMKIEKKLDRNWLATMSQEKKLKLTEKSVKIAKNNPSSMSPHPHSKT